MSFIATRDGIALHCCSWGEGEPVLFVHSAGVSSRLWDYQLPAFAQRGFRAIAYDRRGHGLSERVGHGYDYDTLADDLAAVVAALDLKGATLVGHSMGCGEIVRYLTRHGSARVARIVLIGTTTPLMRQAPDNPSGIPQAAIEAMRADWCEDYPRWIAQNAAPFFVAETSRAMLHWGVDLLLQTPLPVALACNHAVMTEDFRTELKEIAVPALIVHGDQDASAPLALTGEPTASLLPRARLAVYRGAPHGLPFTHTSRLNADIVEFIGRQTG